MSHNMKYFIITSFLSLMFGGAITILFAHAIDRQQTIMQEGY